MLLTYMPLEDEKMTEPLPKWIMKWYSALWNKFRDKVFNHKDALKILDNYGLLGNVLSGLRQAGWLEMKRNPNDGRKRIYKLKSPEQAVKEMKVD